GQLERWENTLTNLIGRSGPVNVASSVPQWLSNTCAVAEPDWSQSPAVLQAEAQRAQALAQLNLSRAQAFPTLSLEAGAGYDFNRGSENSLASDQPDFTVGINLSGSIYDGGASAAGQEAADHALVAADAAIRNSRLNVSSALTQAQSQIGSLQQMLASLTAREGMMQQTRDLYRQQYVELGTRTLLDLLNAEQELHESRFQIANTIHDLRRLNISCLYNTGKVRKEFGVNPKMVRGGTPSQ